MTGHQYTSGRPRGFAPWRPRAATLKLVEQVIEVIAEYDEVTLTIRQVFYRLVGTRGYSKTTTAYKNLCEVVNRARRSGRIPFDAIRDDGITVDEPPYDEDEADFWSGVEIEAEQFRLDRRRGQEVYLEVWCEAAGMVPQLATVAADYGVPVISSGGFNSVTATYQGSVRIVRRDIQTVVLHIGDHDPSGCAIVDAAAADVGAFVSARGGGVEFERVAVTPEQIERLDLQTAPPKATDKRGDWQGETVQAEALDPLVLRAELRAAIERWTDQAVLDGVLEEERATRSRLLAEVERVTGDAQ